MALRLRTSVQCVSSSKPFVARSKGQQAKRAMTCRVSATSSEDSSIVTNPIFTDEFKKVLREALDREGVDALTRGAVRVADVPKMNAAEEVLLTAIAVSRRSLQRLLMMQMELQAAVDQERKQLERLQFGLESLTSDHAYMASLAKRLQECQINWEREGKDQ